MHSLMHYFLFSRQVHCQLIGSLYLIVLNEKVQGMTLSQESWPELRVLNVARYWTNHQLLFCRPTWIWSRTRRFEPVFSFSVFVCQGNHGVVPNLVQAGFVNGETRVLKPCSRFLILRNWPDRREGSRTVSWLRQEGYIGDTVQWNTLQLILHQVLNKSLYSKRQFFSKFETSWFRMSVKVGVKY